jgi:PAS domain S-box-containing protein
MNASFSRRKQSGEITSGPVILHNEPLEDILSSLNVGIWEWDLQSGLITYSRLLSGMLGRPFSPSSAISFDTLLSFIHPSDLPGFRDSLDRCLKAEDKVFECEIRMQHKDGHWIWVLDRGKIVSRHTDGSPLTMVGVLHDVSKRKEAETERNRKQDFLELLLAITTDMTRAESFTAGLLLVLRHVCDATHWSYGEVWEVNSDRGFLELGPVWYSREASLRTYYEVSKKYHFPRGEGLPGRAWAVREAVWIRDVRQDDAFHRKAEAIRHGLCSGVAIPVLTDGEVSQVLVFFMFGEQDEDGDFISMISGVALHLGQLFSWKKAEERVRQLSEQYEKVFNGSQSSMFLVRVTGEGDFHYLQTNRAYSETSGYSQEEILGKTPFDLFGQEQGERIVAQYRRCIREGRPVNYQIELISHGRKHVVYAELTPVTENGQVRYLVGSSTDITEKEKLLTDLLIAKDKAESGDRLKTAFLNNMSHEIRTPLNGIIGFGELLTHSEPGSARQRHFLEKLQVSSQRLMDTIDKIVDASMILSGSLETHMSEVSLQDFLSGVFGKYREAGRNKGLDMQMDVREGLPGQSLFTDGSLLEKALGHLLDNAVKFTRQGTVRMTVYSRAEGEVSLRVEDTGCGMAEDYLNHAFDPFSQEDIAMSRGHEGNGLGLTVAKGIIENLGGSIRVVSTKGKGTCFLASLPWDSRSSGRSD